MSDFETRIAFRTDRVDGRPDRVVIYELIAGSPPDTVFAFDDLVEVLQVGVIKPIVMQRVYQAVRQSRAALLEDHNIDLASVQGVGYRVTRPEEHLTAAVVRRDRAQEQLARGAALLENLDFDGLPEAMRKSARGQLMVMRGLWQAVEDSQRRQARTEAVLDTVRHQQDRDSEQLADVTEQVADTRRDVDRLLAELDL